MEAITLKELCTLDYVSNLNNTYNKYRKTVFDKFLEQVNKEASKSTALEYAAIFEISEGQYYLVLEGSEIQKYSETFLYNIFFTQNKRGYKIPKKAMKVEAYFTDWVERFTEEKENIDKIFNKLAAHIGGNVGDFYIYKLKENNSMETKCKWCHELLSRPPDPKDLELWIGDGCVYHRKCYMEMLNHQEDFIVPEEFIKAKGVIKNKYMNVPEQKTLSLTIKNTEYNNSVTIEIANTDCTLSDFIEQLVIPALHAYGYHADSINEVFANEGEIYERRKEANCSCCS